MKKPTRTRLAGSPGLPAREPPLPPVRHMTIVAQDPGVRRSGAILTAKVAVPAEDLSEGPMGYRVQVVDYDATTKRFHGCHQLPASYDHEPAAWRRGDPRIVDDYAFHAQNAYALVMKTLARFEFALGRRLGWRFRTHQLKLAPHGMYDANAFYSPDIEGLVFGYFRGRSGVPVYTCLSHDIVVHETTHALIDALRGRYLDPSNPDQAAFHEGFADVIALLSVFALPEVVKHLLHPEGSGRPATSLIGAGEVTAEALRKSALFGLAEEMGREIEGLRGSALRQSATLEPDPKLRTTREFLEPHRRGELFVAAVMQGFINAWADRISGSGVPGQQEYALTRVVEEGSDIADKLVTMWVRALDYMPPVHLEFGDALSAALTSDHEVRPDDSRYQLRSHMLEQFKAYGFQPASKRTTPLGIWDPPPPDLRYDRVRFESMRADKDEVFRFIWDNRDRLELRGGAYTEVLSVRPCVRTGIDGFVLRETVAEYYQVARLTPQELKTRDIKPPPAYLARLRQVNRERVGGRGFGSLAADPQSGGQEPRAALDEDEELTTPLYGGGILIFDEYGRVKYWVHNDVFGGRQEGRLEYLWNEGYLKAGRGGASYRGARLSTIHRLRATDARKSPAAGW